LKKLGHTSNRILQLLSVNTNKCRDNLLPQPDTNEQYQMAEATIGALANLATATTADLGVVAALTQANSRLAEQKEGNSTELRDLKVLVHKERRDKRGQISFKPSQNNYCWMHGCKVGSTHMSLTCKLTKPGHK
jgi:hypothetical protein